MSATFDRDAARQVLNAIEPAVMEWHPEVLDALEACVRPAPQQATDRDASNGLVGPVEAGEYDATQWMLWQQRAERAEAALAALPPVGGVTLTREEADLFLALMRGMRTWTYEQDALAQRLGVS